jgi:CMP-N-acetylneuraminic acid synthetase
MKILVPARAGSSRFPGKNTVLVPFVWKMLPKEMNILTLLSTDDPRLIASKPDLVLVRERPAELCTAEASMKDVMFDAAKFMGMDGDELLVTLYPTYIDRTWADVQKILAFQDSLDADHVMCADPIYDVSVHKCFVAGGDYQAKPAIEHDLYRAQDYPVCFEQSCYVMVTKVGHIPELNDRLWSPTTKFFPMGKRRFDIDTIEDFKEWARSCE